MASDLVIAFESIGVGSAGRLYFFGRGSAPSWGSDSAWVEGSLQGWPGEVASSISFALGCGSCTRWEVEADAVQPGSLRARCAV